MANCGGCDNVKLIVTEGQSILFTYENSSFQHWTNVEWRKHVLTGAFPLQRLFRTTNEGPNWTDRWHLSVTVLHFTLPELNTDDFRLVPTCGSQSFPIWLRTCSQAAVSQWLDTSYTKQWKWDGPTLQNSSRWWIFWIHEPLWWTPLRLDWVTAVSQHVSSYCAISRGSGKWPGGWVGTNSLITDVMLSTCTLMCIINW